MKYTCKGSVRGSCGINHRTYEAASKHCDKDYCDCKSQGGYSDRRIVAVDSEAEQDMNWRRSK